MTAWQTARDELIVYEHMWHDGAPHQGQCEGCTTTAWHMKDAVYLNARGVSSAILTTGRWDEVASYVEFMGYTQPWYSVRVPHLLHNGSRQRAGERIDGAARHDAVRPRRGVGGQPRRPPGLSVFADG